jgi:hypothetical protein
MGEEGSTGWKDTLAVSAGGLTRTVPVSLVRVV